jgi:acyl dehydratase
MMSSMATDQLKSIGFIGAGVMGTHMIKRLLRKGFVVRVWNRTPAKVDPLVSLDAARAANRADAANGADAVLLRLTHAAAVDAALFASGGGALAAVAPWGPVLGNYGLNELRFVKPVKPGDRIKVRVTCAQKSLRAEKGWGEVAWDTEITNQNGETVASYDVLTMVSTLEVPDRAA